MRNRVATEALSGKVVLITGGAKRVGAAIARRLHAAGANLMLHYRSAKAESLELQKALHGAPRELRGHSAGEPAQRRRATRAGAHDRHAASAGSTRS